MRDRLARLTRDDVNRAIRAHLSGTDLHVVIVTPDAEGLRARLVSDAESSVAYDAPKPQAVLDEDKAIGTLKLNIAPTAVAITQVDAVFRD
jgi:zinc protease